MKEQLSENIKEMFKTQLLGALEVATQKMFTQVNNCFEEGMKQLLNRVDQEEARAIQVQDLLQQQAKSLTSIAESLNQQIFNQLQASTNQKVEIQVQQQSPQKSDGKTLQQQVNELLQAFKFDEAIQITKHNPNYIQQVLLLLDYKKLFQLQPPPFQLSTMLSLLSILSDLLVNPQVKKMLEIETIIAWIWELVLNMNISQDFPQKKELQNVYAKLSMFGNNNETYTSSIRPIVSYIQKVAKFQ